MQKTLDQFAIGERGVVRIVAGEGKSFHRFVAPNGQLALTSAIVTN